MSTSCRENAYHGLYYGLSILLIVAFVFLGGCATVADTTAPCFLSERHAQDKVVRDHPVPKTKTPLPTHVDQNIQDRQDLGDAVADYNDLRHHVRDNCQ